MRLNGNTRGAGWVSRARLAGALSIVGALACSDGSSTVGPETLSPEGRASFTGNNAPSGSHFELNIIGVPQDKTADMTGSSGHSIFVQLIGGDAAPALNGKDFNTISRLNKIFLFPAPPGESFQVLDRNATDANGATFQLPADVSTTWTVWARALGKPNGSANMTTCATVAVTDPVTLVTTNEVDCSLATLTIPPRTKNSKFSNVSPDLLFISIVVDPTSNAGLATCLGVTTATTVTVPLFNGCLQNFFWNYQNNGLKLLQLRFYPS
jgi:hypothetical protein